jgi:hypothetical protein
MEMKCPDCGAEATAVSIGGITGFQVLHKSGCKTAKETVGKIKMRTIGRL